jgi:hypothetical protein
MKRHLLPARGHDAGEAEYEDTRPEDEIETVGDSFDIPVSAERKGDFAEARLVGTETRRWLDLTKGGLS